MKSGDLMKLDVKNLSFSYSSKDVLSEIDFRSDQGEVLGILGENGCGKTTLLKCINSLLKPSVGKVEMVDFDPEQLSPKTLRKLEDGSIDVRDLSTKELARAIAVVSQSTTVTFPFTVLDAVKMGRYAHSSDSHDSEFIFKCLSEAGALELVHRHVNELSGGELRRVMIARALVQEPSVLLLDEPTLHLDVIHQIELMELISNLSKKHNMLIIMVTHDMMLAARYCDRIILMQDGKIINSGSREDVMTEENLRKVFRVKCRISEDPEIRGLNVVIIGKADADSGQ